MNLKGMENPAQDFAGTYRVVGMSIKKIIMISFFLALLLMAIRRFTIKCSTYVEHTENSSCD
jgi:hypothetical protein